MPDRPCFISVSNIIKKAAAMYVRHGNDLVTSGSDYSIPFQAGTGFSMEEGMKPRLVLFAGSVGTLMRDSPESTWFTLTKSNNSSILSCRIPSSNLIKAQ